MANVNNTLYPPQVDTIMPAFIYFNESKETTSLKVTFSISDYNSIDDIAGILFTVNYQKNNVPALDWNEYPCGQAFYEYVENPPLDNGKYVRKDGDFYYFQVWATMMQNERFNKDEYYTCQIRLVKKGCPPIPEENKGAPTSSWLSDNLEYFSEYSPVTILKAIPKSHGELLLSGIPAQKDTATVVNSLLDISGSILFDEDTSEIIDNYTLTLQMPLSMGGDILWQKKFYSDINNPSKIKYVSVNQKLQIQDPTIYYKIILEYETSNGYINREKWDCRPTIRTKTFDLNPVLNQDDAYIELSFTCDEESGTYIEGSTREIIRNKFGENTWDIIYSDTQNPFTLDEEGQIIYPTTKVRDFLIEAGTFYRYVLRITKPGEEGVQSEQTADMNVKWTDYDHAYLYGEDGRQLKMSLSPSLSSFKQKVSDSIYETLGSPYPIVVRNGVMKYKQFSFSSYISYEADENKIFFGGDLDPKDANDTCLASQVQYLSAFSATVGSDLNNVIPEFFYEKRFRDSVIPFLMDGRPKVFKSPSEGLLLVRLSDVSFTPNQQLGRKIWQFSATISEIGEFNFENLEKYNLMQKGIKV